jgi:predicted nucleotidyltransferase component of viral defense system
MTDRGFGLPDLHEDTSLFRAALTNTEAGTGFVARLIEKDYYCSLVLGYLCSRKDTPLVFKGGTCLSKVYTDFYRLSEDLDFVIPLSSECKRAERRTKIKPVKQLLPHISKDIPALGVINNLVGHNLSTQYIAYLEYESAVTGKSERIKVEIGLREPLLRPGESRPARTLLVSGLTRQPAVLPLDVMVMDLSEAYAEKCRAALTRREPAIRDFFDIDYGSTRLGLNLFDSEFIATVKKKLAVPGNDRVNVSDARKKALLRQVDPHLRSVLRQTDVGEFDLDHVFEAVKRLADRVVK